MFYFLPWQELYFKNTLHECHQHKNNADSSAATIWGFKLVPWKHHRYVTDEPHISHINKNVLDI